MANKMCIRDRIYRAYRYPYSYVPQEPVPVEVPIERIDNVTYRVPGAGAFGAKKVIDVEGTLPYYQDVALCVATDDEEDLSQREKVFEVDTQVFHPDVYKRQVCHCDWHVYSSGGKGNRAVE